MTDKAKEAPARTTLSPKALEHARGFLSALFMGLRTAQIHDPGNTAFNKAVDLVHRSADGLYAATGGFQIQFVDESAFLNGVRLRFEGGAYSAMRALRTLLESQSLGGVKMLTPPTPQGVRTLILLFSKSVHGEDGVTKDDVERAQIGILGVQRFSDGSQEFRVDRRVFAVQSYAKLILALREQFERADTARDCNWTSTPAPPRMRVVRVIQDLVELAADRVDFVLRLSLNALGAAPEELYGANTCLLSIALAHALGIQRQDIVDLAVGALFHPIGFRIGDDGGKLEARHVHASVARMFQESGVGRSSYTRIVVAAEALMNPDADQPIHPYSRIVRVAANLVCRLIGFPVPPATDPLSALTGLYEDDSGMLDRRVVDLLVNVLRAYPASCEVILDRGGSATVMSQVGASRWDRPIVRVDETSRNLDLMVKDGGRFVDRIEATRMFLGKSNVPTRTLDEVSFPPLLDASLIEPEPDLLSPEHLLVVDAAPGEVLDATIVPVEDDEPAPLPMEALVEAAPEATPAPEGRRERVRVRVPAQRIVAPRNVAKEGERGRIGVSVTPVTPPPPDDPE